MSESEGGEKKVGVFGALIAAIGMIFARGADDCARIGAKGAQFADDGARFASKGAQFGDDALRGGKLGGLTDDAVRGGRPHGSLPGLSDDALNAAAHSEKAAAGFGDDVIEHGLDLSLDIASEMDFGANNNQYDENEWPGSPAGRDLKVQAASKSGIERAMAQQELSQPKAIAIVPSNEDSFAGMFGYAAPKGVVQSMNLVADLLDQQQGEPADELEFAKMVAAERKSNPLVILGYTSLDAVNQIVFPNGQSVGDKDIHAACVNVGINCIVIACDSKEIKESGSCVRSAYILWANRASEISKPKSKKTLATFTSQLLHDRMTARHGDQMIISRVLFQPNHKPSLIRSRLKPRTHSR